VKPIARALVVEDDLRLSRALAAVLGPVAAEVRSCATAGAACALLREWRPELVVLDFKLPDGDARAVLQAMRELPALPAVVAMSAYASSAESFELATLGVRAYLEKPLELEAMERAIATALSTVPDVTPHVRQAVGRVGLKEMESRIRELMLDEALGRAGGSRRGAAKLLSISRQLLQHAIRGRSG
jgi:DNA-binding NtrC family response regulator